MPRPQRRIALPAAVIGAVAVLVAAVLIVRSNRGTPADLRVTPLISNTGLELHPAFSPDGTRIAYAWSVSQQQQSAIYVKLNGPGDAVKMTKDLRRVFSPAWSPDGRWIAALQDLGRVGVILLIPASGGQFKELARVKKADPSADRMQPVSVSLWCGLVRVRTGLVARWQVPVYCLGNSPGLAVGDCASVG